MQYGSRDGTSVREIRYAITNSYMNVDCTNHVYYLDLYLSIIVFLTVYILHIVFSENFKQITLALHIDSTVL